MLRHQHFFLFIYIFLKTIFYKKYIYICFFYFVLYIYFVAMLVSRTLRDLPMSRLYILQDATVIYIDIQFVSIYTHFYIKEKRKTIQHIYYIKIQYFFFCRVSFVSKLRARVIQISNGIRILIIVSYIIYITFIYISF